MFSSSSSVDDNDDEYSRYGEIKKEVLSTIDTEGFIAAATLPSTNTTTSWTEAHDKYCTKHETLKATTGQVTKEIYGDITWAFPSKNMTGVLTEVNEIVDSLRSKRGVSANSTLNNATTTPTKRTYISSTTQIMMSPLRFAGSSIMRYLANDDDPDDGDGWTQDSDDAFRDDNESSSSDLGLNIAIFNFALIESAIKCLEIEISCLSSDTSHFVLGLSEWTSWVNSAITKHDTGIFQDMNRNNNNLSLEDNDLLLQVLVLLNKARSFRRQKQNGLDVIVLSSTAMTTTTTTDTNKLLTLHDDCIPENMHIQICLWDIQKAIERNEEKLKEWSEQVITYNTKALHYKKKNLIKLAMNQVQRRKVIEQQVESTSSIQLNLVQTKTAIESAETNQSMVKLMTDSTQVLKQIREKNPIEDIDEVIDDYRSELEEAQIVDESLASLGGNFSALDEDELLEELKGLSLNDDVIFSETSVSEKEQDTGVKLFVVETKCHEDVNNFSKNTQKEAYTLTERKDYQCVDSAVSNGVECKKANLPSNNSKGRLPELA